MSNTKFKVGDKVRVRKDLEIGIKYGEVTLLARMAYLRGKLFTIESVSNIHRNCYGIGSWLMSEEMLEPVFTKADLKTGHIVTVRRGGKFVVFKNLEGNFDGVNIKDSEKSYFVNIGSMGYNLFDEYDDNLCVRTVTASDYDIMKVEEVDTVAALTNERAYDLANKKTIWERSVPKKMTLAEIEKELGYPVEVVE